MEITENKIEKGQILKRVLPGDEVTPLMMSFCSKMVLGNGLVQDKEKVFCTKGGSLQFFYPNRFRILANQKRYIPTPNHHVIGLIIDRKADYYIVDIGAPEYAILPSTAFQGATNKNKPNIAVRSLVFAKVFTYSNDLPPELTCIEPRAANKSWVTKETIFGELVEGILFNLPLMHCILLNDPKNTILKKLGEEYSYEIAIGMNGKVWIRSNDTKTEINIKNFILSGLNPGFQ